MRPVRIYSLLAIVTSMLIGCTSPMQHSDSFINPSDIGYDKARLMAEAEAPKSLFREDQTVLSDEEITRIFATKLEYPAEGKMAILRFGRWYGYWVGWSEDFARLDQQLQDNFATRLETSKHIGNASALPSLVTPTQMAIPYLRQAAARVQANLLLIYRSTSRVYEKHRLFGKDHIKAHCTVEVIVLDTRSGLIPFSTIVTEDYSADRTDKDTNFAETTARAEQQATGKALMRIADEVVAFLDESKPTTRAAARDTDR